MKNPGHLALSRILIPPLLYSVYWMKRSILFRIWNLLKFTSHRWYRSFRGCCLLSFCNKANCAFKTPTNGAPAPNFCSNLGISALSKSISETIDLLLTIDYWIPSLTLRNLTISVANKSNIWLQIHVWFLGKIWNAIKLSIAMSLELIIRVCAIQRRVVDLLPLLCFEWHLFHELRLILLISSIWFIFFAGS